MAKRNLPERNVKSLYKKQRIETAPIGNELSDLEKLPFDILEKVIVNLRGSDILKLSECSKHLNSIIGSSSKLLQGIKFCFPTKNVVKAGVTSSECYKEAGKRKYSNIYFRYIININDITATLAPLENFKTFVKEIDFFYVSKTVLIKVLSMCNNVEVVKIGHLHGYSFNQDYFERFDENAYDFPDINVSAEIAEREYQKGPKPLNLPHLKVLCFPNVNPFLDLFMDCRLEKLEIDETIGKKNTTLHKLRLQRFLQKQTELKSIRFDHLGDRIFRDDEMIKMPFKLKELTIHFLHLTEQSLPHFKCFLEAHRNSLESFGLIEVPFLPVPLLEILINFKMMKKLYITITEGSSTEFPVMERLENLHIDVERRVVLPKLGDKVPNLKYLSIMCNVPKFLDEIIKGLKQLNEIKFSYCEIRESLSIDTVKKLIFVGCKFNNCKVNFKGVTELSIQYANPKNLKWLAPFLEENRGKLKYLELEYVVAPAEVRTFLNSDHKIDQVIYGTRVKFEETAK